MRRKISEMMPGLVSTIIPVHNRPELLRRAVESVLTQNYRPIEIIIVDDGSTDDTPQVIKQLVEQPEVRSAETQSVGPGLAREAGRQIARGQFIQYLDSDDLLLPEKFRLQVTGLNNNSECDVAYGMTQFCRSGEQQKLEPWKGTGHKRETMFPSFLLDRWWGTSTPLYRKAILDVVGPWTAYTSEEDWEYDCRIAAEGARLFYVPEFVSQEHDHSGDRLSRGSKADPFKLQSRAQVRSLIFQHALHGGIIHQNTEMQHFARSCFLLARQCGAAGLSKESQQLFDLSRQAAGPARSRGMDYRLYGAIAICFGWKNAGRLAQYRDLVRNGRSAQVPAEQ